MKSIPVLAALCLAAAAWLRPQRRLSSTPEPDKGLALLARARTRTQGERGSGFPWNGHTWLM